jgi:hypothetical protein
MLLLEQDSKQKIISVNLLHKCLKSIYLTEADWLCGKLTGLAAYLIGVARMMNNCLNCNTAMCKICFIVLQLLIHHRNTNCCYGNATMTSLFLLSSYKILHTAVKDTTLFNTAYNLADRVSVVTK